MEHKNQQLLIEIEVQSNFSYPDSCYPGTSLNWAADLPYFMLMLQKLWAVQWVWPIIAYVFILYSEIRTNLSYGHPLIPRRPDKRGLTVSAHESNPGLSKLLFDFNRSCMQNCTTRRLD